MLQFRRQRFGDVDHRIVAFCDPAKQLLSLLDVGYRKCIQPQGCETIDAVISAHYCDLIHTFPLPFPGWNHLISHSAYR